MVLQRQVMRAEQSSRRLQTKMLTTPTQTSLTSQPVLLDSLNTLTTPLPPSPIHLPTVSTRYRDWEIHGFHSMLYSIVQWRIHPGTGGTCPSRFQTEGDSHAKVPPPPSAHFLTHSDAIAGFTSQSLCLPAYACKTSSTAIKVAPRMQQNLPF